MRRRLLGAALLALVGGPAIGQEAIYGDFGVALGQPFDQRMAQGTVMLPGNIEALRFQPSYPLYLFRDYYAVVTPRTRLVAGIAQVTAGCEMMNFRRNCAQFAQSMSAAHWGKG